MELLETYTDGVKHAPEGLVIGQCRKCGKEFTKPDETSLLLALRMHDSRSHTNKIPTASAAAIRRGFEKAKKKKKYRFPSDDPAYRKSRGYGKKKAWTKLRASKAGKARWLKDKPLANGVAHPIESITGEAAKAILLAANVIRGVATTLKLGGGQ